MQPTILNIHQHLLHFVPQPALAHEGAFLVQITETLKFNVSDRNTPTLHTDTQFLVIFLFPTNTTSLFQPSELICKPWVSRFTNVPATYKSPYTKSRFVPFPHRLHAVVMPCQKTCPSNYAFFVLKFLSHTIGHHTLPALYHTSSSYRTSCTGTSSYRRLFWPSCACASPVPQSRRGT